jgi:chemotaxis protein MotB
MTKEGEIAADRTPQLNTEHQDKNKPGVCWWCLLGALLPFALLIGLIWIIGSGVQERHLSAQAAMIKQEQEIVQLRAALADKGVALASVGIKTGAVQAGFDTERLRLQNVPAQNGLAVAAASATLNVSDIMDGVAHLSPAEKAVLFDNIPAFNGFAAWKAVRTLEDQRAWLERMPLSDGVLSDPNVDPVALSAALKRKTSEANALRWALLRETQKRNAEATPRLNLAIIASLEQTKLALQRRLATAEKASLEARNALAARSQEVATAAKRIALLEDQHKSSTAAQKSALSDANKVISALRQKLDGARQAHAVALKESRSKVEALELSLAAARSTSTEALEQKTRALRQKDLQLRQCVERVERSDNPYLNDGSTADLVSRLRSRLGASSFNPSALGFCTTGQDTRSEVLSSGLAFSTGETELSKKGAVALAKIAAQIKEELADRPDESWRLVIEGHTDKRPIVSGRYPSNWELSALRASAVVRFLADQGVDPERMVAVGRGPFDPIDPGNDPEAYEKNRRIEIYLASEL